jgi:hypothetical protein
MFTETYHDSEIINLQEMNMKHSVFINGSWNFFLSQIMAQEMHLKEC